MFTRPMMNWRVEGHGDDLMILDGSRLVGSMRKQAPGWRIEVLWSGPSGDITFHAATMPEALAFLAGVEKAFTAMMDVTS